MSIFKSFLNKLPQSRSCAEHGYDCVKKCSFLKNGYKDGRPFEAFNSKKKKKKHAGIFRSEQ